MSVIDPAVSVRLGAAGARRLVGLLAEVALLLEHPGPVGLSDEQADVLGQGTDRDELASWTRALAAELRSQL
ncbi:MULTISPECIES: hypothetical protein [unclassified Streptomyces]|uniref:Uncharacterized protein n=1 Tax=Streptomyces sp. R33 TaxID=3238629 RepID=A0AB39YCC1_9ACTN|nr:MULTISPECIES: hypothetical protein [unclassified Streptomyces]KOY56979.1 hypothetical protein ADK59_16015 [Streptomyces sp. XY332]TDU79781.1 hypothetical protein EDD91_6606 [Streptomyces sp. KS 21]THA41491.1 hypothetical protein E6W17_00765 [Streptomyces sp. A1547]